MTYRSALLSRLAMGNLNRKIAHPQSVFAWLTRDQHIVELYQSDNKCNFVFTATGFRDLFTLVQRANHARCFRTTPHELPILLIATTAGTGSEGNWCAVWRACTMPRGKRMWM